MEIGNLLPIPAISNKRFPEARELQDGGLHQVLFRFGPSDYTQMAQIWKDAHPEDGSPLRVEDKPPEGFAPPDPTKSRSSPRQWGQISIRRS